MDLAEDVSRQSDGEPDARPSDTAFAQKLAKVIKSDKKFHEKAFDRMARDMHVAMHGAEKEWAKGNYRANIIGRHVKQKTASLYAKNPKATAKRPESLDFAIWDEDPQSLQMALQMVQMGMQMQAQAAAAQAPMIDGMTGEIIPPAPPPLPPEVLEAQALLADFQEGMKRREMFKKIGKTLEILFAHAMREQKPVDFKTGMKQCVRRAATTGVGYVELGIQREFGPRPGLTEQLADARARLDHIRRLQDELAEGEIEQDDPEMAELERSIASLQAEEEIVLREGLIFDFPQSTKVIPDRLCRSLVGFIGARHVTVEYLFTPQEVEEMFEGVDLKKNYAGYGINGKANEDVSAENRVQDDNEDAYTEKEAGMVCVWKHYDKPSGLVYYLADGYPDFLREPAPPDVFVEDFWPLYALTFNAVESEDELFPPSDVTLLLDMQQAYNESRQGKRQHRKAAQPRWAFERGALDPEDIEALKTAKPYDAIALNSIQGKSLSDVLQPIPVPGVDPNLYDTGEIISDVQLVGGMQESNYGGVAKATATESAIAANSSASTDGSAIDDLDSFLTCIARSGGQILLREMSEEKVREVVGPGAVWPHLTLVQIASEVFLEVEAGSSGKPNQAIEIENFTKMAPMLVQIPGIQPLWLAREALRRMDDRLDLTEAISEGIPSIVMQNSQQQPGTGDPATDPAAQAGQGGENGPPPPPEQAGTGPAFGSNQV